MPNRSAAAGLQWFSSRPVQHAPLNQASGGSVTDMVLLSDERIAAVPVRDCGDPLVDLQADPDGWYARVR
jgi:hypothetical protein